MDSLPVSGKAPSTSERSFSCPHCGAYTSQTWSRYYGRPLGNDDPLPTKYDLESWIKLAETSRDPEEKTKFKEGMDHIRRVQLGKPFLDKLSSDGRNPHFDLINVHTSRCYVCSEMAIWVHEKMIYPRAMGGEQANPDLPPEIRADFDEARSILDLSPRGAAALLRLCVQKLCAHLGERGKNIDDDIASLVGKGLAPGIQQALDAVRIIGNEAVHPGTMDLKDDRATASELFSILNFIADEMLSKPAKLQAIYAKLPADKLKGVAQRNARALQGKAP